MQEISIAARWTRIRERVAQACTRAGRDADEVTIIAVGKRFPAARIAQAHMAGARHFGENYATELAAKAPELPADAIWHMIGPLQRRQVNRLPRHQLWVHTLDRLALANRFRRVYPAPLPPFLIQVNIGREPQKAGVAPEQLGALLDALTADHPDLDLRGLMAIPPLHEDPESTRPYFAALRNLAERHANAFRRRPPALSMGMSGDFEVAIAEGATHVRIGSAIFGPRPD